MGIIFRVFFMAQLFISCNSRFLIFPSMLSVTGPFSTLLFRSAGVIDEKFGIPKDPKKKHGSDEHFPFESCRIDKICEQISPEK